MKKIILSLIAIFILTVSSEVKAQDFFDTSVPEKLFTFGARVGFNTSDRSFPDGKYTNHIVTSWGTGFNAGVVANLNFREYLSLQPGFFFESRSGNLVNIVEYYKGNVISPEYLDTHYGILHRRAFFFTIPIMGIVKFNLADNIKWNVEAGPYVQFCLKENGGQNDITLIDFIPAQVYYQAKYSKVDFGFKLGTGMTLYQHYYVGVHYLAGVCNAWSTPSGGKNKSWMFTVGYDF